MFLDNRVKNKKKSFIIHFSCQNIINIIIAGGKLALLGSACGSACEVGQTPNVPMWAGIKLFFKMCGGKIFKTIVLA